MHFLRGRKKYGPGNLTVIGKPLYNLANMKDSDNLDAWLQMNSPMRAPCGPSGPFGIPYNSLGFLRLATADPPWNGDGPRRQVPNLSVICLQQKD